MKASENYSKVEFRHGWYSVRWLILSLLVILSITFFPYLFGGKTFLPSDMFDTMMAPYNAEYGPPQAQNHFPFDGMAQTYPYKVQTKEALLKGTFAYWNPHILAGYPQYAEPMANNYDVFNVMLLWLSPKDVIQYETVIELFIAGLGMILLLRFFGITPIINLLFASAYMLNSLFIANAMHRWIIGSFCWMPLIVLMILRYFDSEKKENILFGSIFLALAFLGGHFQTSFFTIVVVSTVILFYPSRNSRVRFLRRLGILAFTGVLAFSLTAFMWLPTLELFYQTLFHGGNLISSGVFAEYSIMQRLLSVPLLIIFFFPGLLGGPDIYSVKRIAGTDFNDFNGAITFLPMLFAIWGCMKYWKVANMRPFILLAVAAIFIPIATPLYSAVYHRFFIIASLSLCIIGAVSFQSFVESAEVRASFAGFLKWTNRIFVMIIGGLAVLWVFIELNYASLVERFTKYVFSNIQDSAFGVGNESWMLSRVEKTLHFYSSFTPILWLPILSAGIILTLLHYYSKDRVSKRNLLLISCFATLLVLFLFTRSWFPSIDEKQFPIYPPNPIASFLQKDITGARFIVWRDASKDPYILCRNGSNIYKTNDIHGYESLTNRSMIVFYLRNVPPDSLDLRLLGLVNVKYIITGRKVLSSPYLQKLYTADSTTVWENLLCKPRAYFSFKVIVVPSDSEAAKILIRPDFDGSMALFVKGDEPPTLPNSVDGRGTIRFDTSENEEVRMTATTETSGLLILTDTYYPGWKCYVNGKRQKIHRVNNCMRAVSLDAGTSSIVFRFEPDVFASGLMISAASASFFLISVLLIKRKKK